MQINDARARQLFNGQLKVVMPMQAAGGSKGGAAGGGKRSRRNRGAGQQGAGQDEDEEEAIEDDDEPAPAAAAAQNAVAGGHRKRQLPASALAAGQPGGSRKRGGHGGQQATVQDAFGRAGAQPQGAAGAARQGAGAAYGGTTPIDLTGLSEDDDQVEDSAFPAGAGRRSGPGSNRGRLTPEEVAAARQRRRSGTAAQGAGSSGEGGAPPRQQAGPKHYASNSPEYMAVTMGLDGLRQWLADLKQSKPQHIFSPLVGGCSSLLAASSNNHQHHWSACIQDHLFRKHCASSLTYIHKKTRREHP
jgi:hypothetical protein